MSTVAAKTKVQKDLFLALKRGRAGQGIAAKPDMKAFAERIAARLKKQYGERVTPDSAGLMEYLRSDASCPSVSTPHSS